MIEEKEDSKGRLTKQKVIIQKRGREFTNVALYRFDFEEQGDFLPFFSKDNKSAPKHLNSFCDYIILAERDNKVMALLVELKRGDKSKAKKQLEASQEFMRYILRSAERIKSTNGMENFDMNEVELRKVAVVKNITGKMASQFNGLTTDEKSGVIEWDDSWPFLLNKFI